MVATDRLEEIPRDTTHVLLACRKEIVALGLKEKILDLALTMRLCGKTSPRPPVTPAPRALRAHSTQRSAAGRPDIELEDVTVEASGKRILDRVCWTVREGERWAVFGPNGAGKTTLLSLIQGDHPQVYAQNIRLFGASPASTQSLWKTRMRIGWLSPELTLHYPSEWWCLDVVCSGYFNSLGLFHGCSPSRRANARRWLRQMGLDRVEREAFGALSTGVQRMVLLCRAAVKRPRLLVLDEPCQGVDAGHRQAILRAVDRLVEETGATLLFVSHHRDELPRCVTRVLELRRGKVVKAA
jgi:molybdate transport system ATP-binding protein